MRKISLVLVAFLAIAVMRSIVIGAPPATQPLATTEGPTVVRGTVEEVRAVKLKEVAEPQLLAKVRTADGTLMVASLGSANTLRGGAMERGTKVGMLGVMGAINGKAVFFAQRVDTAAPTTAQATSATTKPAAR
jgi:uncharacterized protein (UPF0128 family)